MWTPAETYSAYLTDQELYRQTALSIADRVTQYLKTSSVAFHNINARAKDPLELYKKQVRKGYTNPWTDCPDLVGARIIVPSSDLKALVVSALYDLEGLEVLDVEDQEVGSDPSSLHYKGLHVHVRDNAAVNSHNYAIRCEIQVRTIAEHAWSETTHKYMYKQPIDIPSDTQRIFWRLLALVELFDKELALGAEAVSSLDSFKQLELARFLEARQRDFTDAPNDLPITLELIQSLCNAGYGPPAALEKTVEEYVVRNGDSLRAFYANNAAHLNTYDVATDWFISQAEVLLMLALMEEDEYRLGNTLVGHALYEVVETLALKTDHPGFVTRN